MCKEKHYSRRQMKIYINSINEDWIIDRLIKEWNQFNSPQQKYIFGKKDLIWIIAPWTWKKIPRYFLKSKKVLCTIHHIDEDKFDHEQENEFKVRDKYVDHYHTISNKTYHQLKQITKKPITEIPWWVNQNIWFDIGDKQYIYDKFGLPKDKYLIGSFQRDTEGYDLKSPKLSKGPDRLIDNIIEIQSIKKNVLVILAGRRRQYVIEKLKNYNIEFKYFEMLNFSELNELYNVLDLYIVSSRYEGGPQSIVECAASRTPIVSTDVGIASQILSEESIYSNNILDAKPNLDYAEKMITNLKIPNGFLKFNKLLKEINEN